MSFSGDERGTGRRSGTTAAFLRVCNRVAHAEVSMSHVFAVLV